MTNIKYLTASIGSSATSYTFTDSSINDDCSIKLVTAPPTIKITGASQTGNSCTVTFEGGVAFSLRAEISNIGEFKVDADGDEDDAMPATEEFASDEDLNALAEIVDDRVPDPATLGAYLYHSTTGNTWKKPDASNLDYDENSTIYSAIGDIDDLETTATNLVDAVNEVKNSQAAPILSYRRDTITTSSTGVTIENGGYTKYGNIVIVNLLLRLTAPNTALAFNGFPRAMFSVNISAGISSLFGGSTYPSVWGFINDNGQMQVRFNPSTSELQTNKYLQVMAVYLTNDV